MFKPKKKAPQINFSEAIQQQIYEAQGNHYQRLKRHYQAIEAYKKSLELNHSKFESAYKLAETQLMVVEADKALEELQTMFGLGSVNY